MTYLAIIEQGDQSFGAYLPALPAREALVWRWQQRRDSLRQAQDRPSLPLDPARGKRSG
ncbi:MAG: hypothetical protein JXA57_20030 [Armatimonadetes bacterium]|nr:hypothetical protein [Armatimonadota bacterium]